VVPFAARKSAPNQLQHCRHWPACQQGVLTLMALHSPGQLHARLLWLLAGLQKSAWQLLVQTASALHGRTPGHRGWSCVHPCRDLCHDRASCHASSAALQALTAQLCHGEQQRQHGQPQRPQQQPLQLAALSSDPAQGAH
jgi:hypothetical protein